MNFFLIIITLCSMMLSYSQDQKIFIKGLTRKEIKEIKRNKKEQDRIARFINMGLNEWGIDENAQTWYLALKYHLPSSRQANGLPILRQYQTFTEEFFKNFSFMDN